MVAMTALSLVPCVKVKLSRRGLQGIYFANSSTSNRQRRGQNSTWRESRTEYAIGKRAYPYSGLAGAIGPT